MWPSLGPVFSFLFIALWLQFHKTNKHFQKLTSYFYIIDSILCLWKIVCTVFQLIRAYSVTTTSTEKRNENALKYPSCLDFYLILIQMCFLFPCIPLNKWKTKWAPIAFQYSNIKLKHAFYAVYGFDFNDFQLEWISRTIDIKFFMCVPLLFSNRVFPLKICQKNKNKNLTKIGKIKDASHTE